jgi:hypothetical protein
MIHFDLFLSHVSRISRWYNRSEGTRNEDHSIATTYLAISVIGFVQPACEPARLFG